MNDHVKYRTRGLFRIEFFDGLRALGIFTLVILALSLIVYAGMMIFLPTMPPDYYPVSLNATFYIYFLFVGGFLAGGKIPYHIQVGANRKEAYIVVLKVGLALTAVFMAAFGIYVLLVQLAPGIFNFSFDPLAHLYFDEVTNPLAILFFGIIAFYLYTKSLFFIWLGKRLGGVKTAIILLAYYAIVIGEIVRIIARSYSNYATSYPGNEWVLKYIIGARGFVFNPIYPIVTLTVLIVIHWILNWILVRKMDMK